MKSNALLLLAGIALSSPAHAGWFDWFKPGEWFSGAAEMFSSDDEDARGLYLGGSVGVLRADWGMQRRLGGVDDPFPDDQKYVFEPAYITVGTLRGGWQPFGWLSLESEWGFDIDKAEISETPRQTAELDSLSSIYLKPQLNFGALALIGQVGYSRFSIHADCGRDSSDRNNDVPSDPGLAASCRSFKDNSLMYGAGVDLRLSPQTRLSFVWRQNYEDDFDDNGRDDSVSSFNIAVTMAFGGGDDEDDYY